MEIAPCSKEATQVLDSSLSGQADTEVLLTGGIDGPQLTEKYDEAQKVHANPSPLCRNLFCPWRCISVQQDDQSWPSCQEYLSSHVRMMVRNIQPNRLGNGSPGLVLLILPLLSQHYANDNHAYSRCDCPNVAHFTDLSNRWATQRFHSSLCLLRACTYFPVMSRTSTCFVFPVVCLRVRNRSLQFRTNVGRSLYPYSFALN